MAIYIDENKKVKNIFVNVNGSKKSISSAWVNKDGVPTKVFSINNQKDLYEVAPIDAISNWNYTLDDENNTITLNYHKDNEENVIVYANYYVNGKTYKTQIKNSAMTSVPNSSGKRYWMFQACNNIKHIIFSDIIDISNLTNSQGMFSYSTNILSIHLGKAFNENNIEDMSYMFYYLPKLTTIDLINLDTSNATDMSFMFYSITNNVSSFDLSGFNTSNVKSMWGMFKYNNLNTLDLSSFDTSSVEDMHEMFACYTSNSSILTTLNLCNWDTHNVKNMNNMFKNNSKLESIYATEGKWSTSQATTTSMFSGCGISSVTYI